MGSLDREQRRFSEVRVRGSALHVLTKAETVGSNAYEERTEISSMERSLDLRRDIGRNIDLSLIIIKCKLRGIKNEKAMIGWDQNHWLGSLQRSSYLFFNRGMKGGSGLSSCLSSILCLKMDTSRAKVRGRQVRSLAPTQNIQGDPKMQ